MRKGKDAELETNEFDTYDIKAERLINKMILLVQLNSTKEDVGVDDIDELDPYSQRHC